MQKSIHTQEQVFLSLLLRQVRAEAGLTQVELAQQLGTPHSRISDYERGERRMDLLQLREYLQPLGITLEDFVRRLEAGLAQLNTSPPAPGR